MVDEKGAKDDGPERDEERQPNRRGFSEWAAVCLGLLIQVAALAGEISDWIR